MGGDDERDEEDLRWQVGDAESVRDGFEHMPSLMAATQGPEHTIVAANAAFRALARQPGLIGRPARQVLLAFPGPQLADLLDLVYAAGEPFTGREWPTAGGRYLDFTLAPWRGAGGGMRGVLVIQFDVTERVREQPATGQPAPPGAPSPAWRETVTVQQAMLPDGLPVLAQARVAARYLPAAQEMAGGDWFDAFVLSDGRLALMVGDVAGHGVGAATAMGQFRAVLRQALILQPDLTAALAQADRFAADDAVLRGATLCVAVLEPADGRFRYATCGHPPPWWPHPTGRRTGCPAPGPGRLALAPARPRPAPAPRVWPPPTWRRGPARRYSVRGKSCCCTATGWSKGQPVPWTMAWPTWRQWPGTRWRARPWPPGRREPRPSGSATSPSSYWRRPGTSTT